MTTSAPSSQALALFHPVVRSWLERSFPKLTPAQEMGWPVIASGASTLVCAPTGSGKTLTAFLWCLDRLAFGPRPATPGCRVVYISPLKALAVDVERNLRAPLHGIANLASERDLPITIPSIAVRTGDTPQRDRARFRKQPAEILITTPESLFLILTSGARTTLKTVETVIIDEIHAMVGTKRGSHLALSLERLERLADRPIQRIGLSATQRPLEEVARFLGGAHPRRALPPTDTLRHEPDIVTRVDGELRGEEGVPFRPVTIVDTGEAKRLSIRIEVPVENMASLGTIEEIPSGPAAQPEARRSIWPAIHPRLVELIRMHTSTLVFVNSRRLAERLAAALNDLAGERIAHAHHGSLSRTQRTAIEDALKEGDLPALIATSSLELGIDMGAIDLVIQIEAPPAVSAGMQRIGRASHHVGSVSSGIIFPKYRGDLVSCTAVSLAMSEGRIEASHYPRNPLDVLAQQIVAMVAVEPWNVEDLFTAVRTAAPFAALSRSVFEGVLDMLSGVYPSDDFAGLRPRLNWDRIAGELSARAGAQRVAIANAGTIPDRGLYGVYLAGASGPGARVGELDEEMVLESSPGETFLLGASTWRIEEITWDRVIVSPAPGEPGKMPFWHGESANRSSELGHAIGELQRKLLAPRTSEIDSIVGRSGLDPLAADNLVRYILEQKESGSAVPSDRDIVIERSRDELGDWRICVLSPFGGRLHAPWAMAAIAKIREERGIEVEVMWSDDGFVIRLPESEDPPPAELFLPEPEETRRLVTHQLGATSLFAARFRENAARALLLPRRRPGSRTPLWQQRKKSADLLAVAASYPAFPILLETYRECLLDMFDLPSLERLFERIRSREVRTVVADLDEPSPFASSLLFRYVANYLYDGDAPLAERRAQALTVDPAQLRELIGDIDLRGLLDDEVVFDHERRLQRLDTKLEASPDSIHDLLLHLGDLSSREIRDRAAEANLDATIEDLLRRRRAVEVSLGGMIRLIPVEYASRYRDAIGSPLPAGLPGRLLQPTDDPLGDLLLRYARTHGPFTPRAPAVRYGLGVRTVEQALQRLVGEGRLIEGELTPAASGIEFCHRDVLTTLRHRSLARVRREVEPVEPEALVRFTTGWHRLDHPRAGLNALLDAIEQLQGCPIPASVLETEILPSRICDYDPSHLDTLMAAGEVVWAGLEPLGSSDGRLALYLTDHFSELHPTVTDADAAEEGAGILGLLESRGALHFPEIHHHRGGFPQETLEILWTLVWSGHLTNDSFQPVRSWMRRSQRKSPRGSGGFRSRRMVPPGSEGRWSRIAPLPVADGTARATALASQLLDRYGILTRAVASHERLDGGFTSVYPVLRAMEEAGRIRRGYFVEGVPATQFARPAAIDRLRSVREETESSSTIVLSAVDPANAFGSVLPWPETGGKRPSRSAGSRVILVDGHLGAYLYRGARQMLTFLPEEEPARARVSHGIGRGLVELLGERGRRAILIGVIDGIPATEHAIAEDLLRAGFVRTATGLQLRREVSDARR